MLFYRCGQDAGSSHFFFLVHLHPPSGKNSRPLKITRGRVYVNVARLGRMENLQAARTNVGWNWKPYMFPLLFRRHQADTVDFSSPSINPKIKKKLWHYGFPPNCPVNTQNPKYTLVESGFLITFPIKPINLSCASVAFVSGAWESWLICYEYASSSRLKFLKWVSKMVVSQNGWCLLEILLKWMIWGYP